MSPTMGMMNCRRYPASLVLLVFIKYIGSTILMPLGARKCYVCRLGPGPCTIRRPTAAMLSPLI